MVLHVGTLGTAGSDESDCSDWELGSTIAQLSSSTNVHCSLHRKCHFTRSKRLQIPLTREASSELKWWSSEKLKQLNRISLNPPAINAIISTDAPQKGWGIFLGERTGGRWQKEEDAHINVTELKAAYLAFQAFVKGTMNPRHIQVLMDNSTAVSCINKRGGTHSPTLVSLALKIWNYCISRKIWITARHFSHKHRSRFGIEELQRSNGMGTGRNSQQDGIP